MVARDGLRILVVEDDRDTAETLGLLLNRWGHTAQLATTSRAALDIAEAGAFIPNVAFIDLAMPEIDGIELVRRLRGFASWHAVYVVALTGMTQKSVERAAYEAGCDRYILKPASPERIRELLDEIARDRTA